MVKPTPDPPVCNLPSDHPYFVFPTVQFESDGTVLAERFAHQRKLLQAERGDAEPPRRWQFWRWRKAP